MRRKVVLLIETSSAYGRGLLAGVIRYMRIHDEWSVFLEQRDLTAQPPAWLRNWKGDGIISRMTTPGLVEMVRQTKVPVIDVTDRGQSWGFPLVQTDDFAVGRLGAEHLIERGFRKFGYCGFQGEAWSDRREQGFRNKLTECGFECTTHLSDWLDSSPSWEEEQKSLSRWLIGLDGPVGIMACNDVCGLNILSVCAEEGWAVPEKVAVLGVDNDELLCRASDPALSSVVVNPDGVGFRAAELLAKSMNEHTSVESLTQISPLGIAVRQSTDVVAIDDAGVATALQYIRQNACRGITVDEVVQHSTLSRSSLERKVRKHLGRTPQEEIRNVQIKKVKELLTTTDLPAERIANLCGFEHAEYMYVVFKRHAGMTPGDFRLQALQG